MMFSKIESGRRSETKYQHSTMSEQSSCPKDDALRMSQARRERERERERERGRTYTKQQQHKT
jgi:hypothetical protein